MRDRRRRHRVEGIPRVSTEITRRNDAAQTLVEVLVKAADSEGVPELLFRFVVGVGDSDAPMLRYLGGFHRRSVLVEATGPQMQELDGRRHDRIKR